MEVKWIAAISVSVVLLVGGLVVLILWQTGVIFGDDTATTKSVGNWEKSKTTGNILNEGMYIDKLNASATRMALREQYNNNMYASMVPGSTFELKGKIGATTYRYTIDSVYTTVLPGLKIPGGTQTIYNFVLKDGALIAGIEDPNGIDNTIRITVGSFTSDDIVGGHNTLGLIEVADGVSKDFHNPNFGSEPCYAALSVTDSDGNNHKSEFDAYIATPTPFTVGFSIDGAPYEFNVEQISYVSSDTILFMSGAYVGDIPT